MPPRSSAADTAVSPPEASTRERNSLRQPRLADPSLAADHCRSAGPGADRLPRRLELGQLTLPADQPEQAGRRGPHSGHRVGRRRAA